MKLPFLNHSLSIEADGICPGPFPPCGFLPLADAALGNGDCFGLYWPLEKENNDPIVCELYHDEWLMVPAFSSVEKFREWLDINDGDPYENDIAIEDHSFAPVQFRLAKEYLSSGEMDDALPRLINATKQLPEVSEYWLTLAGQHRRRREDDAAAEAALNAWLSNWTFGMPDNKVIQMLTQAARLPQFRDDPVVRRVAAKEMDLNYGGVKENTNYLMMQACIDDYFSQDKPRLALTLLHNYGYIMSSETTAFQDRYGFNLNEWRMQFSKLCSEHLGDARNHAE
ncbi:tetratricopeptide repeat-containing protein [Superficieibacter sp. HKU1]|uniref:tetratricopeptide repeat-containing protein n=1 Tax=Superficieibacter sp. HKU1 TaxID=3031919 RepID=UPI0023E314DC|nr:tetratricopeptide repeat-containing protein [Superficieibacter sp. HKU1]WES66901.1 tetratricopeptide repeat-containing protein [Superficieibacter sp. HKU1]